MPAIAPQLVVGTCLPTDYKLAVMADANTKSAHFSSAGRSQKEIAPRSSSYLGSVAEEVQQQFEEGKLTSSAQLHYACAIAQVGDAANDSSCSSHLNCSRASASARGVVDWSGIAAVVCAHGIPLLNCAVAMPTPEQWAFHLANLIEACVQRPDIQHIYIDIACRLKESLLAALRELTERQPPLLRCDTIDQASVFALVCFTYLLSKGSTATSAVAFCWHACYRQMCCWHVGCS